jgi:hypothetical protein
VNDEDEVMRDEDADVEFISGCEGHAVTLEQKRRRRGEMGMEREGAHAAGIEACSSTVRSAAENSTQIYKQSCSVPMIDRWMNGKG